MSRFHGFVACIALVAGCDDTDDGLWQLRPGVVEVTSGGNEQTVTLTMTDVDRDGDRIAVVKQSNGIIYAYLSISEDLGKTWRDVQLQKAIYELNGDTAQIGVHLEHGKVYVMLSTDLGSMFAGWGIWEINTETGEATGVEMDPLNTGWFTERRPDGHLWYVMGSAINVFVDLDPATGLRTTAAIPCAGLGCVAIGWRSSDGGNTWDAYSQPQPGAQVCRVHFDAIAKTSTQDCVLRPTWPGTDYDYAPVLMWRGTTPYMAWSTDEQAYATAVLPGGTVSETLQLGPGIIGPGFRTGSFVRPRYADFTLAQYQPGAGVGTLTQLTDAGAEEVHFPITPCVTDDGCGYEGPPSFGYGQVQWILPTDDGDYLVFYAMVTDDQGAQKIYMSRETPTPKPVTGGEPPPEPIVDLPPGAEPMNDLQKACALYLSCRGFDTTYTYKACLAEWITEAATRPGLEAARARFIAAATSCASLATVASSGCPLECTTSGGTCGAGGTGPCSNETTYVPGLCNTCDVDGNFLWCPGEVTYKVACGGGTACSPYGCALTGPNACDAYQPTPSCVGTDVRTCGSPSQLLTYADCSLEGASCDATSASCKPTSTMGACDPVAYSLTCASGTHLLGCAYGQIQYVPCSDIGLTQCVLVAGGAKCQ